MPIHEVGQYNGQHYFSMDFIEGQSLADLVRERPLPPSEAGRLLVPVARAIHFAHQQGILHRDLKPANVLLDLFGRPLVTDFGLAKPMTTAEQPPSQPLTATGAVLGTPSYMPPEQASGRHGVMGPASDVYSLGAILYELVTGRPPFQAATPLDTLLQVLNAQPAPPRLLNPAVSRDLETILLKCLAREPARRYASAEDLARDLEAFLEGRPIKAHRAGLVERSGRWAWRHRGRLMQAAVVAVVSVALVLGGWQAWSHYADAQLGRVHLQGEPGLSAEILDAAGERTVVPRFALPREDPIALPAGDYLVHLTGAKRVSETAQVRALRGDSVSVNVTTRPRWETPNRRHRETHTLVHFGDRFGVVGFDRSRRMYRVDAFNSWEEPAWEIRFGTKPFAETETPFQILHNDGRFPSAAADLDGDGTWDMLWTGWPQRAAAGPFTGLLALSGKTGLPLWHTEVFPSPPAAALKTPHRFHSGTQMHLTNPVTANVDSTPVIVLAAHSLNDGFWPDGPAQPKVYIHTATQRWVHAFSGKTGATLWRFPLEKDWFKDMFEKPLAPLLVTVADQPFVVQLAGSRLLVLDARTGKPAWPVHDLGARADCLPRLIERGPGQPPLLLCQVGSRLSGFLFPEGRPAWPARDLGFKPLRQAPGVAARRSPRLAPGPTG